VVADADWIVLSLLTVLRAADRYHVANVSSQPLVAVTPDFPAQLKDVFPRGEESALYCLRLFFSDSWLTEHLLPVLNTSMARVRLSVSPSNAKFCSAIDVDTWWNFFVTFMLDNYPNAHKLKEETDAYVALKKGGLGVNRQKFVSSAHNINDAELSALISSINTQFLRVFQPGTTICVDEALYSYHGGDMRAAGIDMLMPHKPHKYGLLSYYGTAKLTYSKIAIAFCVEPRTVDNKLAPDAALKQIVRRTLDHTGRGIHVVADSGFFASKTIEALRSYSLRDVCATIAINAGSNSGYKPIYDAGKEHLPAKQARTLWDGSVLFQLSVRDDGHVTAVATTNWHPKNAASAGPMVQISYKTAKTMYQEDTVPAIIRLGGLPPEAALQDKITILRMATGWDVRYPEASTPAEQRSENLTKSDLSGMQRWQLELFSRSLRGAGNVSEKTVDQLKDHIILYRGKPSRRSSPADPPSSPKDELARRQSQMLTDRSDQAPVVDFYSSHYGFIDQIDRAYYATFDPACCKCYQKLFLMSNLWLMLRSAWATNEERKRSRAVEIHKRQKSAGIDSDVSSFTNYMLDVFRAIRAESAAQ
jgi:hypothetical protein